MQKNTDYDLHIIYIRGNGECRDRESYKEFYKVADQTSEYNPQLTSDDERILDIVNSLKIDYTLHEFENDHGLDSGAWYKFIKKGIWQSYDYSFFLMEGFLFTRETVLDSIHVFSSQNKLDYLDMGFEKRIAPRWQIDNLFILGPNPSKMDYLKNETMTAVYRDFSQDDKFKAIYQKWWSEPILKENGIGTTFYHVPSRAYSVFERVKISLKYLIKNKRIYLPVGRFVFQQPQSKPNRLPTVTSGHIEIDKVIFHKEESPYFYGCMCQHVLSRDLLSKFSDKLDKYDLYKTLDYPISAGPLEPIWGLLPAWLGFDKWYFDGVHRPRKNFLTYVREDDVHGMCKYINRYYKGKIKVAPNGDFVKIVTFNYKYKYINNILSEVFYEKNISKNS
jgi:hypothetical protein